MSKCRHCGTPYGNSDNRFDRKNCCIKKCICKTCSHQFESPHVRKYCSDKCNPHVDKKLKNGFRKCAYKYCDKQITGRKDKIYCSDTCRTYASHGNTIVPGVLERRRIENAPHSKIFINTCTVTGQLFTTRYRNKSHNTSLSYHKRNYQLVPKKQIICSSCDVEFESHRDITSSLCPSCRIKENRRIRRSIRRARIRKTKIEVIRPINVFIRDNWTCKLCGVWTPKDLRGKVHSCAPELDHIIPLSKQGTHTYINLQCLCRECNNIKSDKVS